ncbi:Spore maturation protein [Lentibacillus sp. JNUCC-1]|nr:Spore maturation protein [Lentibacillus sp. JNUCC-1]
MSLITSLSTWMIPCFILIVLILSTWKRVPAYELFVEGGKEGIKMAFSILPFLVGMIVSISILRSSGALEAFIVMISPHFPLLGFHLISSL